MDNIDDVLLAKLVAAEHDTLRAQTGQDTDTVPKYRPVAYTMVGNVD